MTPEQVDLIRKSFDAMWPVRGDFADLCYRRFFELALQELCSQAIWNGSGSS